MTRCGVFSFLSPALSIIHLLFESMTRNLGHRRLLLDFVIVFVRFLKVSIWLAVCGFVFTVDCFTSLFLQSISCASVFGFFFWYIENSLFLHNDEANSRFSTLDVFMCTPWQRRRCRRIALYTMWDNWLALDLNYSLANFVSLFFSAKIGYMNMWNICTIFSLGAQCELV